MLFPFAEGGNLKDYLLNHEAPTLTKDFVLWLLTQMRDLASAVQHIHNSTLDRQIPKLDPPSNVSSANLAPGRKRRHSHTGFHYDLKPENILLFSESTPNQPAWKVADFGTAQINELVLSGSARPEGTFRVQDKQGDPEYSAPDVALQGWSSRPYDIWSLGCIYLEILVWIFGLGPGELIQFQQDRLIQSEPQANQSAAFWYQGRQACKLKPKVKEKMQELRDKCKQRGVFGDLFRLTGDMLTIVPKERPNAPTVQNDMSVILRQAEHDLVAEDLYLNPIRDRDEISKPATVVRRKSRPTSIDERSVEVTPETPDHQRPTRIDTGHNRAFSEPAINISPLLAVPGEERLVGQWQPLSPSQSYQSTRSRSPSILVQRPNGEVDSDADSVFDDGAPRAWRQSVTLEGI